ncbi:MAG: LysM peptidoglycan-binding domain-containing protein [Hyphomicrobiaceae bacterium]
MARFDFPAMKLTEGQGRQPPAPQRSIYDTEPGYPARPDVEAAPLPAPRTPAYTPRSYTPPPSPPRGAYRAPSFRDGPDGPPPAGAAPRVTMAPPVDPPARPMARWQPSARPYSAAPPAATPATPSYREPPITTREAAPPARSGEGRTHEVRSGDTLYGLSRRYRVAVSVLMSANNLTSPTIRPGQKLVIPGRGSARPTASTPVEPARPQRTALAPPRATPRAVPPVSTPAGEGTYTVQPGDSLYRIARRLKVTSMALQRENAITDPTKLKPGMVLKIPGKATAARRPLERRPESPATVQPASTKPDTPIRVIQTRPVIIPGRGAPAEAAPQPKREKMAALPRSKPATGGAHFRWPVQGKVVQKFGPRPDGSHSDGIDLAVPPGTDVVAADAGEVAYSGNELAGYGNLVLIRHTNGWVSAYAHNDKLLVKRGDKVRRGQLIAKSGTSGGISQPKLHFELRQGSKPVDPLPYLAR